MRTASTDLSTCYCWDANPDGPGHCVREPGHTGDHHDWYARPSWNHPGTMWAQAATHAPDSPAPMPPPPKRAAPTVGCFGCGTTQGGCQDPRQHGLTR